MKLRRIVALELLTALRSLEGANVNGKSVHFQFDPEVIEKIVDNIVVLRRLAEKADVHRILLAKELSGGKPMSNANPNFGKLQEEMNAYMMEEVELDLRCLSKGELQTTTNPIPISVRERLSVIEPESTVPSCQTPTK
jgi:hypothetical protein